MKTYRLDPQKFAKEKRSIVFLYGIIILILLIIFILVFLKNELNVFTLLLMLVLVGMLIYTAIRSVKQRRLFFEGYLLELDDNQLRQIQPGYPELIINRNEIQSIQEIHSGLIISTQKAVRLLGITKDLPDQDYQEIKAVLTSWLPNSSSDSDKQLTEV